MVMANKKPALYPSACAFQKAQVEGGEGWLALLNKRYKK